MQHGRNHHIKKSDCTKEHTILCKAECTNTYAISLSSAAAITISNTVLSRKAPHKSLSSSLSKGREDNNTLITNFVGDHPTSSTMSPLSLPPSCRHTPLSTQNKVILDNNNNNNNVFNDHNNNVWYDKNEDTVVFMNGRRSRILGTIHTTKYTETTRCEEEETPNRFMIFLFDII